MKVIEPGQPTAALRDDVLDYRGLAAYLKMAEGTLRHKVMRGQIPFFKIGSSVRFSKADIDAWLTEHRQSRKHIALDENGKGELVAGLLAAAGDIA